MFVTIWIGILDLDTGLLTAANAGHEYPLLSRNGDPFSVYKDPHGIVAGTIENAKYRSYTIQMRPGDKMLVYSDGATDALNTEGKAMNLDGLLSLVNTVSRNRMKPLVLEIKEGIIRYFEGTSQFDDITLLAFAYLGSDGRDILTEEELPEL
jgi:serine phosphatase RsbU (regulator of sigma subunit)